MQTVITWRRPMDASLYSPSGNPCTYLLGNALCYIISGMMLLVVGVIITSLTFQNLEAYKDENKERYAGPVLIGAGVLVLARGAFSKLRPPRSQLARRRSFLRRYVRELYNRPILAVSFQNSASFSLCDLQVSDFNDSSSSRNRLYSDEPPSYDLVTSDYYMNLHLNPASPELPHPSLPHSPNSSVPHSPRLLPPSSPLLFSADRTSPSTFFPAGRTSPGFFPAGRTSPGFLLAGRTSPGFLPAGRTSPGFLPAGRTSPSLASAGKVSPSGFPSGRISPAFPTAAAVGRTSPGLLHSSGRHSPSLPAAGGFLSRSRRLSSNLAPALPATNTTSNDYSSNSNNSSSSYYRYGGGEDEVLNAGFSPGDDDDDLQPPPHYDDFIRQTTGADTVRTTRL